MSDHKGVPRAEIVVEEKRPRMVTLAALELRQVVGLRLRELLETARQTAGDTQAPQEGAGVDA